MSIEALLKVIEPPTNPTEADHEISWHYIESSLGLTLPNDFKEFIQRFGTGALLDFLWVFNPFSSNEYLNFMQQINTQLDALRFLVRDTSLEECPYSLYPEPGGLLPWGMTENGDILFWCTEGNPKDWTVVVMASRSPTYEEYNESLTGFLAKLILQEIKSRIFPSLSDSIPLFQPYHPNEAEDS